MRIDVEAGNDISVRPELRWALGVAPYCVNWGASCLGISKSRIGRKLATLSEKDASALRRLVTEMYGE